MGLFKNLSDKAKEVKSKINKQDVLDLVHEAQKTIADGGADDLSKLKAAGQLFKGFGQMAAGKYEGGSRKLENIHKDPYDIQMAEETKAEINDILIEKLNPRKFIYGSPEVVESVGAFIMSKMHFIDLVKDKTLLPSIHEYLKSNGISYDEKALDTEINRAIHNKEFTQILAIRDHVDKYIFIDRMTKQEILTLYERYTYNLAKHYKFQCEVCGLRFEKRPTLNNCRGDNFHVIIPISED